MRIRSLLSRSSISMRLALWYGLSLLILLSAFVAFLYVSVHLGLHRDFDRRLREDAQAIRRHLRAHTQSQSGPVEESAVAHALPSSSEGIVRLLDRDGTILYTSSSSATSFPPTVPSERTSTIRQERLRGHVAQSLYLPLDLETSSARWVEVTKTESALHRQLHRFRWVLVLGIVLGAGAAVAVGYGLARRALRPVDTLTSAASDLQDRASGRLPTDLGADDELSRLAETFNELIGRLRSTIARERRFRADAAHEMCTPLAAIQSEIDVTLRKPRSADTYRDTLQTLRAHSEELSSVLDRLMTLSEVESRSQGPADASIDVGERLRERVDRVRPRAESKGLSITIDGSARAEAPVKPEHIDLIVDHLLENAIKYTPAGGDLRAGVSRDDAGVVLRVTDTGIGFDPAEADQLFDRFFRRPEAEETASGGGLGLSIVQAVARSYGGSIAAHSDGPGEGSMFEVRLPTG